MLELILAFVRGMQALNERTLAEIESRWNALEGDFDDAALNRWLDMAEPLMLAAQRVSGQTTDAYLAELFTMMTGTTHRPLTPPVELFSGSALRRGVPVRDVYARAIIATRVAISDGHTPDEARSIGLERAKVLASTDIRLAQRVMAREAFAKTSGIVGYRRVLTKDSCPLCMVAATQRYKRADLMPIHPRCDCGVAPIFGDKDPGREINAVIIDGRPDDAIDVGRLSPIFPSAREVDHAELGPLLAGAVNIGKASRVTPKSASELYERAMAGGFTFDPRTSIFPDHGVAVAVPGFSKIVPRRDFSPEFLDDYIDEHWDTLQENDRLHLGGWWDKDHDEICFDLTEVFDDRETAIKAGRERNEQAVFDLGTLEEVSTGGTGGRENLVGRDPP